MLAKCNLNHTETIKRTRQDNQPQVQKFSH